MKEYNGSVCRHPQQEIVTNENLSRLANTWTPERGFGSKDLLSNPISFPRPILGIFMNYYKRDQLQNSLVEILFGKKVLVQILD